MESREIPLVWDLEADGLLDDVTKVWCITIYESGSYIHYGPDEIETAVKRLNKRWLICHNQIGFDIPLLKKFYPWFNPAKVDDTFILSSLFEPDRPSHSLASWGEQLGVPKPIHDDWSKYSNEMKVRNMTDVQINVMVWEHLLVERNSGWDWEKAINLEYNIAEVHAKQEANGVGFNRRAAIDLKETIDLELTELTNYILPRMPKIIKPYGEPINKPFKVNGEYTKAVLDWCNGENVGGPFTRLQFEEPNLNSHTQVKNYLLSQGWIPTEYTEKGSPRLTEDSFDSVKGEVPEKVVRRNLLMHRTRLLENTAKNGEDKGLINLIRKDGRITAGGIPQGTPTGRYRHIGVVNIPRVGTAYGSEFRSLFIPKTGWLMVGCDAVGIESRIEGHYCYPYPHGKEHADILLDGDIHQKFADLIGSTRPVAKNVRYACMYGCTPKKLTTILDCKLFKARKIHNDFWSSNEALTSFKEDITKVWEERGGEKGGYLKGLDGRKLFGRSSHSLVNLVFQSAAAIVFKTASIMVNNSIEKEKIKAYQVLSFHDEYEFDVHPKDVDKMLMLSAKAFEAAGKYWELNVPLKGEAKVGKNWEQVH